jgi:hypothetical protein
VALISKCTNHGSILKFGAFEAITFTFIEQLYINIWQNDERKEVMMVRHMLKALQRRLWQMEGVECVKTGGIRTQELH